MLFRSHKSKFSIRDKVLTPKTDKHSKGSKYNDSIRCPTNFKIGPQCFRAERKESLKDRYSIGDSIGKGGFGEVKKVTDKVTGIFKAVKIINKTNCSITTNFANEIEIIRNLVFLYIVIGSSEYSEVL